MGVQGQRTAVLLSSLTLAFMVLMGTGPSCIAPEEEQPVESDYFRERAGQSASGVHEGRPQHGESPLLAANIPYQLKLPPIYDYYEGEYPIRWERMTVSPKRVVFRASTGITDNYRREDGKVREYVVQAKERGLKYGLYHFLIPNKIDEQAALFLKVWHELGGADMPPIADVEIELPKSIGRAVWRDQVKHFLDLIEQGTGRKPMIYTSKTFWTQLCARNLAPEWAADYQFWVAWYPYKDAVDKVDFLPVERRPLGAQQIALWQYSERGRTDKYPANDLNVASPEYLAELELEDNPPPDPEPQPDPEPLPQEPPSMPLPDEPLPEPLPAEAPAENSPDEVLQPEEGSGPGVALP